jgi:hypothetical protein
MPTELRRTVVVHTPEVVRALEVARSHWPGASDALLLTRLIELGARAIESNAD